MITKHQEDSSIILFNIKTIMLDEIIKLLNKDCSSLLYRLSVDIINMIMAEIYKNYRIEMTYFNNTLGTAIISFDDILYKTSTIYRIKSFEPLEMQQQKLKITTQINHQKEFQENICIKSEKYYYEKSEEFFRKKMIKYPFVSRESQIIYINGKIYELIRETPKTFVCKSTYFHFFGFSIFIQNYNNKTYHNY